MIAARQSLQSMISGTRLFSNQRLQRAGRWLRLSTSGQPVRPKNMGCTHNKQYNTNLELEFSFILSGVVDSPDSPKPILRLAHQNRLLSNGCRMPTVATPLRMTTMARRPGLPQCHDDFIDLYQTMSGDTRECRLPSTSRPSSARPSCHCLNGICRERRLGPASPASSGRRARSPAWTWSRSQRPSEAAESATCGRRSRKAICRSGWACSSGTRFRKTFVSVSKRNV